MAPVVLPHEIDLARVRCEHRDPVFPVLGSHHAGGKGGYFPPWRSLAEVVECLSIAVAPSGYEETEGYTETCSHRLVLKRVSEATGLRG
jgi:hypothetical protein